MAIFNLKRGYNIRLEGETSREVANAPYPKTIAVKPNQFLGVKPKLLVKEGDKVQGGSPLFCEKNNADWVFTSPVSGKVKAITRGRKRVIEHIEIETDKENQPVKFKAYPAEQLSTLSRDEVLGQVLKSGMLALFRQRPFDYAANPSVVPRDIFVSAMNTGPLSPDLNLIIKGNEHSFQAGLDAASRLTPGKVHLSVDGNRSDLSSAFANAKNVQLHKFTGPHPAGCVGIQIHHIAPINGRSDNVWHCTVQCLILLGKFFVDGKISPEIIVSVAGSAATERKYFRSITGANVDSIVQGKTMGKSVRYITGDVLTGTKVDQTGYLGLHDSMITIIPESTGPEFIGWMLPGYKKDSFYRTFLSPFLPSKKFEMDTKLNGGLRAFVTTGNYEQVLPMRIYPMFLFKSILAGDIEEMEGLGIYEITEEEVALCEYICPSKGSIQSIVRYGLDLIEKEG